MKNLKNNSIALLLMPFFFYALGAKPDNIEVPGFGRVADPVDLGLSVKWASWSVGASKIADYGGLYGAGDPTGLQTSTSYSDYHYYDVTNSSICGTEYDIARMKWGSNWRMPTSAELKELAEKCIWVHNVMLDGVKGSVATGPNGNTLFFPYSGIRRRTSAENFNTHASLWSGEQSNNNYSHGYIDLDINIFNTGKQRMDGSECYMGQTVRPVYVENGTSDKNKYVLTYILDGEIYKSYEIDFNMPLTPEPIPSKEGYTFSGWSDIPEVMPAHDVVISGSFTANTYTLTYIVDGQEYRRSEVEYGTTITPLEAPTKEGYTFSGWSYIPLTMPDHDVVAYGSFIVNTYTLLYILDGYYYKSFNVESGTTLTLEAVPSKKGMTFSGWGEVPETMPAYNLTLAGTYTWSKETVDGVVYQVADTLNNYATIVDYEGTDGKAKILSYIEIGGDIYEVCSIADNALQKSLTIYTSVGRLLLWLWTNGYANIKETETDNSLSAPEMSLVGATASSLKLSFANPYPELAETVTVSGASVEKEGNGYEIVLNGLEPDNLYDGLASVTLTYEDASYTKFYSFRTEPLTLTALQPKVVSLGNVIVTAESNLDDDETNVGFEWRRIEWTDEFESRTGTAYLYEGIMEGYIRSLNGNYLWKFRPYYTSSAGNTYYSDWKGIDPSDYSFFEPTVHTYEPIAVTDSTAEVKGYAMRGTDDVSSQGFMYWTSASASSRRKVKGVPVDAAVMEVQGHVMRATLEGLDYDTEYCVVAFVKTEAGEMFFGEQQVFRTTSDPDGIQEIEDSTLKIEEAWYSLDGKKLAKPQKGINIIHHSDGTTRKVMVK